MSDSHTNHRVAVLQSSYIPWKGYFDIIAAVDTFVIYDEVQFTSQDWRSRNRIKTQHGLQWLSIPVGNHISRRIDETVVTNGRWARKHCATLQQSMAAAPFAADVFAELVPAYEHLASEQLLSHINIHLMRTIMRLFAIDTPVVNSTDITYDRSLDATGRLVSLCQALGATTYVSGPSAASYLAPEKFAGAGIDLEFVDYSQYREYPQLHGDFEHAVTAIDLLANTGSQAREFLLTPRDRTQPSPLLVPQVMT